MSRTIATSLLCAALTGASLVGCSRSQPQPDPPLVVVVNQMDIPDAVMTSFTRTYAGADIQQVRKEVHEDGTAFYIFAYRTQGAAREARLSRDGEVRR